MALYAVFMLNNVPAQNDSTSHVWAYRSNDVADPAAAINAARADMVAKGATLPNAAKLWVVPVAQLTSYRVDIVTNVTAE